MTSKAPNLAIVFGAAKPKGKAAPDALPEEETLDGEEEEKGQGLPDLLADYEAAPDAQSRAMALAEFVRAVMSGE